MIINKDCLEALKELPDNSIDSIVTDPPYGLSFMGKKWDYDVPSTEIWQECLRVLKPGGYLLAFAGTRTQHRMAVRIEDAGFEIRDMIAWLYGSGFPKSLNIGKAVDKLQGNEREVVDNPYKGRRPNGNAWVEQLSTKPDEYTKGTSEWEGWGTALKPALEPITVARKPIEGTVAENCLKWGVGGINIDESRVETTGKDLEKLNSEWNREWNTNYTDFAEKVGGNAGFNMDKAKKENAGLTGRFPANLIHDNSEEVRECFPEAKGWSSQKHNNFNPYGGNALNESETTRDGFHEGYNDSGNASRFFKSIIYAAKASKSDRGEGNSHPTVKPIKLMEYLVNLVSKEGHTVLDPFCGSGTTGIACKKLNRNFIGVERDEEYCKIATARIESVSQNNTLFV